MRVGVLALQGGFAPHLRALVEIGHEAVEVRDSTRFSEIDGLVLPGGESTTHLLLLARYAMEGPLDDFVRSGRPVLATCAGLILAARHVESPAQRSFGWLDVDVARNAWGRQVHSFEAVADSIADAPPLPLIFIRAPRVKRVGAGVEVRATYQGEPILVRQGQVTGAAFHPELTDERRVHREVFGRA